MNVDNNSYNNSTIGARVNGAEKRDIEGRLASAQRALLMQEDVLRDTERDRKQLIEKVSALERSMSACEANGAKLQVTACVH